MAEPTLGEIESIHGDPNIGLATTGVAPNVIAPNTNELAYLDAAARRRDAANQFLLQQHQANLKSNLEDFGKIDTSNLFQPDYKDITSDYANLTNKIVDNYDVLSNPNKNPELYAEIMQQKAALNSKINQSKAESLLYNQNETFLKAHPEFNTAENLQAQQQFSKTPLGQRQIPNITSPTTYDPKAIIKAATEAATQQIATSAISGGYIKNQTTESTDPDIWYKTIGNVLNTNNGYGGTYKDALVKQYSQLPAEIKQTENFDDFIKNTFPVPKSSITKATTEVDPFTQQAIANKNALTLAAVRHQYDISDAKTKFDNDKELLKLKGEISDEKSLSKQGQFLNTMVANISNSVEKDAPTYTTTLDGRQYHEPVITPSASVKEALAYTKPPAYEGAKTSKVYPDLITKTAEGNFRVFYFEKGKGEHPLTIKGKTKFNEQTQIYTPNELREQLANSPLFTASQRPKILQAAYGASQDLNDPKELAKYGDNSKPNPSSSGQIKEKTSASGSAFKDDATFKKADGTKYTYKALKDLGYTDDQIKQAVDQGNITQ